jgi:hypothetical protein
MLSAGIANLVPLCAVADFEDNAIAICPVFQVMSRTADGEARHHSGPKLNLALVREERRLAVKYIYEFILRRLTQAVSSSRRNS